MKRICLGDLHGDLSLYQQIKSRFPGHKFTLVGDLVDSVHFSRTEQFQLLEEVLNDIECGTTECLLGNHEWSYLSRRMQCTGFTPGFAERLKPLKSRMTALLKPFIFDDSYQDPILFTHAGLSSRLLEDVKYGSTSDVIIFLEQDLMNLDSGLSYHIGRSRGGPEQVGGIFWCDFNEDFRPIRGLRQVFGHTIVRGIVEVAPGNYHIDCLRQENPQILKIDDDGKIAVIDL